jgi:hypothetical protein
MLIAFSLIAIALGHPCIGVLFALGTYALSDD